MATNRNHNHPPKWAIKLLEWYCREDLLEDLLGDLYEYYARNLERGQRLANFIFIIDVLKFFRSYTFKKLKNKSKMNSYMLFKNYFKTSIRSLARNRLFSFINIIGLAISMSVGLLVITLIVEVQLFDNFHKNGDHIYRVVNTRVRATGEVMNMASTSYFLSEKLDEYNYYQSKTTLYKGFGGDADADGKKLVLSGIWASKDFFKVFSFPMVEGDPSSALAEPNSLVLTETSAKKIYGDTPAMGKILRVNEVEYLIKGIMKDPPINSHIKFESLASIGTLINLSRDDPDWAKSTTMWRTYIYLTVATDSAYHQMTQTLNQICETENKLIAPEKITAALQPLADIFTGAPLGNQLGPTVPTAATLIFAILPLIILLTACFNYTNLSIARSLRRSTEVGIRRVIGATRGNIFAQFVVESVILALMALVVAIILFIPLREQFLVMLDGDGVSLPINGLLILWFVGFAIFAGILASLIPATTLSKFQAVTVLRSKASVKIFAGMTLRKVLLVAQFSISTLLILMTIILNKQYHHAMNYDLGFSTAQILNVELQGNNHRVMKSALAQVADVKSISKCHSIVHGHRMTIVDGKYKNPGDSAQIHINFVDENYLTNHKFNLIAGENFKSRPDSAQEQYTIVNQKLLERFEIGGELEALGEKIELDGHWLSIIGVVEDFNHSMLNSPIEPYAFRYNPFEYEYLNLLVETNDYIATIDKLEAEWSKVDELHPFTASYYDEHIENTYVMFEMLIKIVGFLALLAISIAAMGLFGMSVYAVETKIKEISIRKVMGASSFKLVYLLSRSYVWLLVISSLIAAPFTYFLTNEIILTEFVYFSPMSIWDVLGGLLVVFSIGLVMIGFQTYRAAQMNPADTLRNE
ncbi:MacB-like core domain-containing protein [Reichenbachiella faecimaris]|uniref:MacB-like core domain-containing protein n=1 Tax=Reichenbachiella faecimaris TaxID=692418 RepID=A0A1W2GJG1_REIFA|nr:ABC transporter permease [Reichenbachiella faecimaris]SMD36396.1 MacB-like core domain-containing protein [Reichenbachiella faecimaris]